MKIGLIGKNIGYSKSKEIFEQNFGCEYILFDIEENEIEATINYMRKNDFVGFNVTTPYKETIQKFLISYTPNLGSNVVKITQNGLIGDSVDYKAWFDAIPSYVWEKMNTWKPIRSIGILGNGGVVSSLMQAFKNSVFKNVKDNDIIIYARTPKIIGGQAYRTRKLEDFRYDEHDLIINTIPYTANLNISFPFFDGCPHFIFTDLNYADDTLVNQAKEHLNCVFAQNGLEMLKKNAEYTYNFFKKGLQ